MGPPRTPASALLAGAFLLLVLASPAAATGSASTDQSYGRFGDPQVVTIQGYAGSAMEPNISPDSHYLLFNTSNVAPSIPALQFATGIDSRTFTYKGAVGGANQPGALSGTPTLDGAGNLYFVSSRSYAQTLSTVYTGQFSAGQVAGVHLVSGISGAAAGTVDFDVDVSLDGATLYVSVGQFTGGSTPTSSHLSIFDKQGSGFVPDPHSARILHAVNGSRSLVYGASISPDGLELFFTRATGGKPGIFRAVRSQLGRPFGHVQRVAAIKGFAEAPSLSADGGTLYYHLLVGTQFDIESVTRPPGASGAPVGD